MSYQRLKNAFKALKSGHRTYGDLSQTHPTMDRKYLLLNTGKNDSQVFNNLMNNKICWALIDKEHNIQSVHRLASTPAGFLGILGDELDSNQRVLLGNAATVTAYFVFISDKEDAT